MLTSRISTELPQKIPLLANFPYLQLQWADIVKLLREFPFAKSSEKSFLLLLISSTTDDWCWWCSTLVSVWWKFIECIKRNVNKWKAFLLFATHLFENFLFDDGFYYGKKKAQYEKSQSRETWGGFKFHSRGNCGNAMRWKKLWSLLFKCFQTTR